MQTETILASHYFFAGEAMAKFIGNYTAEEQRRILKLFQQHVASPRMQAFIICGRKELLYDMVDSAPPDINIALYILLLVYYYDQTFHQGLAIINATAPKDPLPAPPLGGEPPSELCPSLVGGESV